MTKRKLLLADDSVTIQKVVNLTFADEGIEVIAVGDGNSAVTAFADTKPDIVLADVNMPGLSGYEVCERIRGGGPKSGVPVILLVGSFEQFDQARAAHAGANAHITKPFQSIRQLVTMVTELLADAAAPIPAPAASTAPQGFQTTAAIPGLGDELMDSYSPDVVPMHQAEAPNDDILAGSELDTLLRGTGASGSPGQVDDFNILDIPAASVPPSQAVQPERFVPPPPPPPPPLEARPASPFTAPVAPPAPPAAAPRTAAAPELSPQAIEMIAERLSQKISEDAVREIAHKIVPEVTAMIIKKMVERASRR